MPDESVSFPLELASFNTQTPDTVWVRMVGKVFWFKTWFVVWGLGVRVKFSVVELQWSQGMHGMFWGLEFPASCLRRRRCRAG